MPFVGGPGVGRNGVWEFRSKLLVDWEWCGSMVPTMRPTRLFQLAAIPTCSVGRSELSSSPLSVRLAEAGGDLAWGQREAAEREDCGDGAFPGGELPFEAP